MRHFVAAVLLTHLLFGCAAATDGDVDETPIDAPNGKGDGSIATLPFALTADRPMAVFTGQCNEFLLCDIVAMVSPTDAAAKQAARLYFADQPSATTFEWNWGEIWLERDGSVVEPSPAYGGRRAKIEVDRDSEAADGLTVRRSKHIVGGIWEKFNEFYWGDLGRKAAFKIKVELKPEALDTGVPEVDATIQVDWS